MATKTISIRIFHHDQLVDTRSFTQDVIKLGRLGSSHVRLEDLAVGRMHAVIEVGSTGDVRVIDLGSTSGTQLNGATLRGNSALRSGDSLELGPYRLELAIAPAAAAAAVAPAPAPAAPVADVPAATAAAASAPIADHAARTAVAARPNDPQADLDLARIEEEGEVAEVVASYGRSVLDVAHVGQGRSQTRSAKPLMALGGLLMLGGLSLFAYEVNQPWEEYGAAVTEAQKHHRELPEAPGLGTGSFGMGLALLGLVPFVAGLMRRRDHGLDTYTIGESSAASFKVPGYSLPNPAATAIVASSAGGYALAFTQDMTGSVAVGGHELSLRDLIESGRAQLQAGAYSYMLPSGARARLEHGDVRFSVNLVKRGAVIAGRGEVDWPFWGYFGGTATIATAFYFLMRSMPDDAMAVQMADDDAAARFASYFQQADEKTEVEPEESVEQPTSEDTQGGETGQKAGGAEGKMGDKSSSNNSGAYAMKGPQNAVPRMARDYDPVAAANQAGILGILSAQDKHFLASADGGAFAIGNDDADIWGNLAGADQAAAYGVGGLGLVGSGRGGGGADGLVGLGGAGLLGHGNGTGGLYNGRGDGGVTGFGDRRKKVPAPRIGKGTVTGQIDKNMIRRIVRAHINEVRSCYNAGLTKNPNLQGRVSVQFSIVGNGKVASSVVQENTTKDSSVANCIAKAVKRWKFPRVNGGGTALVTYPFILNAR